MQRRMRERRDGDGAAGPPFTAAPTWAMDHVIHVHRITYLTKSKAKHVRNYARFVELDAAAAAREAEGDGAPGGAAYEAAVGAMAEALEGSVRPIGTSTPIARLQQRIELVLAGDDIRKAFAGWQFGAMVPGGC